MFTTRKVMVLKVGRKWIHLANGEKIDIRRGCTSHPKYPQWERLVYKDEASYNAQVAYCKSIDTANKIIRDFTNQRNSNKDIIAVAEFIKQLKEKGAKAPNSIEPTEYD